MVDFRHEGETYDVAILGSGLGGSALAAILARQGQRVLLLEKGAHPRFGVPEIQHLSNRHGVVYRERVDVRDLEIGDEGVVLRSAEGEEFHARFLIDGTGHKSTLFPGESLTEDLLYAGEALLAAVEEGVISAEEASQRIFEHLQLVPLPPVHGWADFNVAVLGGMAPDAHAPVPARTPREELAIAMA